MNKTLEAEFDEIFGMFFKDLPFQIELHGGTIYQGNLNQLKKPLLEFIEDHTKVNNKDIPMGVSQWREHGKKYGYTKFLEEPYCELCHKKMKNYTPTEGKFKGQLQEYTWVCECSPNMFLSRL